MVIKHHSCTIAPYLLLEFGILWNNPDRILICMLITNVCGNFWHFLFLFIELIFLFLLLYRASHCWDLHASFKAILDLLQWLSLRNNCLNIAPCGKLYAPYCCDCSHGNQMRISRESRRRRGFPFPRIPGNYFDQVNPCSTR